MLDLSTYIIQARETARRKIRSYKDCKEGVSALEFALVFPIVLTIFFGIAELGYYKMIDRRAQFSVDFAAEFMSRDSDGTTSWEEIWVMEDIWQVVNVSSFYNTGGDAYANSRGKYTRSFASIEFERTPSGCVGSACTYKPDVEWSFMASQGIANPKRRSCNQTLVPNGTSIDATKLPEGVKGRSALAVADFTYRYVPLFGDFLIPESEKHIYAIRKTRGGETLARSANSGHFVQC